jgi:predicted SprT family Zn-dependent metalloprotease
LADTDDVSKRLQIVVSIACLAVIGLGARYVYARETLRDQDLTPLYRTTGRVLFGDDMPAAQVQWAYLGKDYGTEQTFNDGSIEILIDRELVTSEEQLRAVIEHEICHAYVDQQGGEPEEHGAMFQTCMRVFE